MNKLKLLDLFSGIGGFSLGLESTGFFKTIAFVEKDKFCRQVLQKNFNNIPIEEDIRNVRGSNYEADIITGGFPCQPFSVAGKRKGTDDDRYLWDETIRVVAECKPRWFIGENVEGLININNGMVLRQVQTDLEEQGFQVQCLVIPASGIGAWHQRKRVWILAHSNSNRNRNEITGSNGEKKEIQGEHRQKDSSTWKFIGADTHDVPNTDSRLCGGRRTEFKSGDDKEWGFCSKKEEQAGYDIRSKTIGCDDILRKEKDVWHSKSTGLQSSSDRQRQGKFWGTGTPGEQCHKTWWQIESGICGVPHGLSATMDKNRANRIKALGNSIVPQIARELGLAIMKAELNV
jgi:DNA (cytosine-5)-methyltransferase 1